MKARWPPASLTALPPVPMPVRRHRVAPAAADAVGPAGARDAVVALVAVDPVPRPVPGKLIVVPGGPLKTPVAEAESMAAPFSAFSVPNTQSTG